MHTRSVFLKHEDAQERESRKVLQTFNSSRHYMFNNEIKRFREKSDFHGQKLCSCPEGRKDHRQWFLYVSGRDAKERVWQLEKQEKRKSCSFYLICFVCFYIPFLWVISSFFFLSIKLIHSFLHSSCHKKELFFIFLLNAFSVLLSYTTFYSVPQHYPNLLQMHPHYGHICVHMTAVVVSTNVCCMFYWLRRSYWELITSINIHPSALEEAGACQQIEAAICSPSSTNSSSNSPKGLKHIWFFHTFTLFLLFKSTLRLTRPVTMW